MIRTMIFTWVSLLLVLSLAASTNGQTTILTLPTSSSTEESCFHTYLTAYSNIPQYLSSYNYPFPYPRHHTQCWIISARDISMRVKLEIVSFETEEYHDSVEIMDDSPYGSPLAMWSGTLFDEEVISFGQRLYVQFTSDGSIVEKGFELKYTQTTEENQDSECESVIANIIPRTYILSSLDYSTNGGLEDYCWIVTTGDVSQSVQLEITSLRTAGQMPFCSEDYFIVRDGDHSQAQIQLEVCGILTESRVVTSSGPYMYLGFHRDDPYHEFYVQVEIGTHVKDGDEDDCISYEVGHFMGFLTSPNFPAPYPPDSSVCWEISGQDPSLPVRIILLTFHLEGDQGNCVHDYLDIYDGMEGGDHLGRWCSAHDYITIDTIQSSARLHFVSDGTVESSGFRIHFYQPDLIEVSPSDGLDNWLLWVLIFTVQFPTAFILYAIIAAVLRCRKGKNHQATAAQEVQVDTVTAGVPSAHIQGLTTTPPYTPPNDYGLYMTPVSASAQHDKRESGVYEVVD